MLIIYFLPQTEATLSHLAFHSPSAAACYWSVLAPGCLLAGRTVGMEFISIPTTSPPTPTPYSASPPPNSPTPHLPLSRDLFLIEEEDASAIDHSTARRKKLYKRSCLSQQEMAAGCVLRTRSARTSTGRLRFILYMLTRGGGLLVRYTVCLSIIIM